MCFGICNPVNNKHAIHHDECCGCEGNLCCCIGCLCASATSNNRGNGCDDDCGKCCIGCITCAWLGVIFIALLAGVQRMFEVAFSFIAFISIFACLGPFIYMIVVYGQASSDSDCSDDLKNKLLVLGLCNLVNFIFCVYLMCRYGVYNNKMEYIRYTRFTQIICHIISRDPVVVFYSCYMIFATVWAILCFNANRTDCESRVITAYDVNHILLIIYICICLFIFVFCACVESYDNSEYDYQQKQFSRSKTFDNSKIKPKSTRYKQRFHGFGPWGGKKNKHAKPYEDNNGIQPQYLQYNHNQRQYVQPQYNPNPQPQQPAYVQQQPQYYPQQQQPQIQNQMGQQPQMNNNNYPPQQNPYQGNDAYQQQQMHQNSGNYNYPSSDSQKQQAKKEKKGGFDGLKERASKLFGMFGGSKKKEQPPTAVPNKQPMQPPQQQAPYNQPQYYPQQQQQQQNPHPYGQNY